MQLDHEEWFAFVDRLVAPKADWPGRYIRKTSESLLNVRAQIDQLHAELSRLRQVRCVRHEEIKRLIGEANKFNDAEASVGSFWL